MTSDLYFMAQTTYVTIFVYTVVALVGSVLRETHPNRVRCSFVPFSSSEALSALSVFWKVSRCREESDSTRDTHSDASLVSNDNGDCNNTHKKISNMLLSSSEDTCLSESVLNLFAIQITGWLMWSWKSYC